MRDIEMADRSDVDNSDQQDSDVTVKDANSQID